MNAIVLSKCLIVTFVTTVTLWYFVTPYIVQPHSGIIRDLLSKAPLVESISTVQSGTSRPQEGDHNQHSIRVENWTKWRIYVRGQSDKVIHRGTSDLVHINNSKAVMYMEWRPEYEIVVTPAADSFSSPEVEISAPLLSFQRWGIYNHLATEWAEGGTVLRVFPRFLFGIPVQTVTQMYSGPTTADLLSNLPIIGVFTQSTRYDRVIIQAYMNLVTLSVIFLLWSNNPPESLLKKGDVAAPTASSGASGCIERDAGNPNDSSDAEEDKVSNSRRRRSSAVVQ